MTTGLTKRKIFDGCDSAIYAASGESASLIGQTFLPEGIGSGKLGGRGGKGISALKP
jgi:hypothetical protein